jgi:hypothetical protein
LPRTVFVSDKLSFALSADVIIRYKTAFDLTTKSDGQTYLQTLTQELRMDPKTGTVYASNLFNGNKLLGETHVLQFSKCSKLFLDVTTVYRALKWFSSLRCKERSGRRLGNSVIK